MRCTIASDTRSPRLLSAVRRGALLPVREVIFDYEHYEGKLGLVEKLQGQSGWMRVTLLSVSALETEDALLMYGLTDDGQFLDKETCEKLLAVPGTVGQDHVLPTELPLKLSALLAVERRQVLDDTMNRNHKYFDAETEKLEAWAEDLKDTLERRDQETGTSDPGCQEGSPADRGLEGKGRSPEKDQRTGADAQRQRKSLFAAQDKVEDEKDKLITNIEGRLQQKVAAEEVFTIRWRVC